jgi:hypothetical protein
MTLAVSQITIGIYLPQDAPYPVVCVRESPGVETTSWRLSGAHRAGVALPPTAGCGRPR